MLRFSSCSLGSKTHGWGVLCNSLLLAALFFHSQSFFRLERNKMAHSCRLILVFFNIRQDDVKWSQLHRSCSTDFICIGVLSCTFWEQVVWGLGTHLSCSVFQERYERRRILKKLEERKRNKLKRLGGTGREMVPRWSRCQNSVLAGAKLPCLLSDFDLKLKINKW